MDSRNHIHRVLMLPWLAHGHISPFLALAKKLIQRNFEVFLCSTPVNLNPIREDHVTGHLSSIKFVDIHLSTVELSPDYHTTKNLPPYLMPVLKTAFDGAKESFRDILGVLKPDLVIYDFLQPWAPEVARDEKIEAVLFFSSGAASSSYLCHVAQNPDEDYPIPEFNFPRTHSQKITQFLNRVSNGLTDKERLLQCIERSSSCVLVKTAEEIEKIYIDHFSMQVKKEVVPVGHLVENPGNNPDDSDFMEWLSKKDPSSVVFVSFGSEYFLSKEEIEAISRGLELSNLSFIWVVRINREEHPHLREVVPEEFKKRVAERGKLVEGWAPQAKILEHPSTGGFVSHCGWSSTLESIKFGVPIIAMPMQLDQPLNAKLVINIGVGMEVQRENEYYRAEEIARVIRKVVLEEEGKEVRKKVKETSEKIKEKGDQEIDHVAKKLVELVR